MSTVLEELSSVQMALRRNRISDDNQILSDFQHHLSTIETTLTDSSEYLNAVNNIYCPTGLLSSTCFAYSQLVVNEAGSFSDTLEAIMTLSFHGNINDLIHQTNDGLKQALTNLSSCVMNYSQILSQFQSYISEFNIDTSTMSGGNYNSLLTLFNNDLVWLKNLKDSYMSGVATKQDLAQLFSNTSPNQLLINIENVMTTIDQSVIFDINSFTTTMTTQAVAGYSSMMTYLSRLRGILGSDNVFIEEAARSLLIWQMPQFTSNQAELSWLMSSSATFNTIGSYSVYSQMAI